MFRGPDHVHRRPLEIGQPLTEGEHPVCGTLQTPELEQSAATRQVETGAQQLLLLLPVGTQQKVYTGSKSGDHIDHHARSLGEGVHVERIGDHHTVEPDALPEQVVDHLGGQRGGQVVAPGERREGVVPDHHHPRTGFHRGAERHQLDFLEPLAVVVEHGKLIVRIDHRIALAGEMLGHRCHPFRLEPAHHRRRHLAHPSRVIAEGADAERWVVGMRGQIAYRGVVDRDPECSQLTTHRPYPPPR